MFSVPKKNADGKYFAKPVEKTLVQIDNVRLISSDETTVTIGFSPDTVNKITDFDAKIIQAAKDNSELWFSRKVADKTIEAGFNRVIADGDMMNVSKAPGSKIYMNKQVIETIEDGSMCDVVLEFSGVTFGKKNYAPSWKLVQTRVRPPKKKIYDEYLFQGDSEGSDSD